MMKMTMRQLAQKHKHKFRKKMKKIMFMLRVRKCKKIVAVVEKKIAQKTKPINKKGKKLIIYKWMMRKNEF